MDSCHVDMSDRDVRLCYDGQDGAWGPILIMQSLIIQDNARGGRRRDGRHLRFYAEGSLGE